MLELPTSETETENTETSNDTESDSVKEAPDSDESSLLERPEKSHDTVSVVPVTPSTELVSSDICYVASRHKRATLMPYGLPCIRELLRFLVSIINMRERYIYMYIEW